VTFSRRPACKRGLVTAHPGDPASSPLSCPACRIIDRADGVEDGNLFKVEQFHVGHERHLLEAVMKVQDRVADQVRAFTGSLKFV